MDPSVPAILITPICAHTLSFRPLHLRDNIEIKVLVPLDARHTAWVNVHSLFLFLFLSLSLSLSHG